ncbi:4-galactosyl-N-acetylglucosaminide 3-alpha-L-fucosyltransferase FUT6-like [Clavelina lepadiformis]|uniref:4-galactosyl-N-acetylglucosaminide 3-alpha-L-fucosyltransferase FUT6-like n=1 Tax=Clavelina lepadiformis TaxID=159417 RepID=UPI0040433B12
MFLLLFQGMRPLSCIAVCFALLFCFSIAGLWISKASTDAILRTFSPNTNFATKLFNASSFPFFAQSLENTSVGKHEEDGRRMTLREALHFASLKTKIILEWCSSKASPNERRCGSCKVTDDRSLISNPDTAAVVFNKACGQRSNMPPDHIRRPDQLYIWRNAESPPNTHNFKNIELDDFEENYFNATETYRRDSDFYKPYSASRQIKKQIMKYRDLHKKNKTSFGVWIVSNCGGSSGAKRRMDLYRNLTKAGLKIDVAGRCFHRDLTPRRGTDAFLSTLHKYKFYFSFENSYHCRDYITEKFYSHGLAAGTVPVVTGPRRENYEAVAPPHSFIHTDDFDSPKALVDYLNYLDSNDTAYKEYFAWRDKLLEDDDLLLKHQLHVTGHCLLCRHLHGIDTGPMSHQAIYLDAGSSRDEGDDEVIVMKTMKEMKVKSIKNWWYDGEDADCI